jgi:cytochrome o ubiquinol oxidase subunit 2
MNSFFIPQLGSQIYTMAGMTTQLNLQADEVGTYQGLSAQFSGDGFADMRFKVVATAPQEFQRWMAQTRTRGGALDRAKFAELLKPARAAEPVSFARIDPDLFAVVSSGKIATRWSPEEAR